MTKLKKALVAASACLDIAIIIRGFYRDHKEEIDSSIEKIVVFFKQSSVSRKAIAIKN